VPFASEAQYRAYVDAPAPYRPYLTQMLCPHPARLPHAMDHGAPVHDASLAVKQDLIVRRIQVQATGAVFALRPSCGMP